MLQGSSSSGAVNSNTVQTELQAAAPGSVLPADGSNQQSFLHHLNAHTAIRLSNHILRCSRAYSRAVKNLGAMSNNQKNTTNLVVLERNYQPFRSNPKMLTAASTAAGGHQAGNLPLKAYSDLNALEHPCMRSQDTLNKEKEMLNDDLE